MDFTVSDQPHCRAKSSRNLYIHKVSCNPLVYTLLFSSRSTPFHLILTKFHQFLPIFTNFQQSSPNSTKFHQISLNSTNSEVNSTGSHQPRSRPRKLPKRIYIYTFRAIHQFTRSYFHPNSHHFTSFSLNFTKFHQFSPIFTKFHQISPGFTKFHQF